jgi:hypothetical protein
MATTLTVQTVDRTGYDHTTSATAADVAGNNWANTGAEFLAVTNGGGSPITVTLVPNSNYQIDGQTPASRTVTVGAGKTRLIGPFPTGLYNDVNQRMNVTYSGVTTVTVSVCKLAG